VTLLARRTFARVPAGRRPPGLSDAARVSLAAWRRRGEQQPYMFGHGRRFKTVKWWPSWYGALGVLDGLAGYPQLWRDAAPDDPDRRALAELLACLVAYNVGADGRVVPRSAYRDLGAFPFARKHSPSPLATARVLAVLAAYDGLAEDVAAVDVGALGSSKGGAGTAVPPRRRELT
jgi:hypothetical protein